MKNPMSLTSWSMRGAFAVSVALLTACGSHHAPEGKNLALTDYQALGGIDDTKIAAWDRDNNGAFSTIFGGTSKDHVRSYLRERIKRIFTKAELEDAEILPRKFAYEAYLKQPKQTGAKDGEAPKEKSDEGESPAVHMASNIGSMFWLRGNIDQVPVSLKVGEEIIPIDSPRAGLILLGPGYAKTIKTKDGEVQVPAMVRAETLVHEGRHSDCTVTVTENDIQSARSASNIYDFIAKYPIECGQLHSICTKGPLEGMFACDRQPWGAYAVGAIFSDALSRQAKSEREKMMLQMSALDSYSRLYYTKEELLGGSLGTAAMNEVRQPKQLKRDQ